VIKLNEIEEQILKESYKSYLKESHCCTCMHPMGSDELANSKIDALRHLEELMFINVQLRSMGQTEYNILQSGISYIQSQY
jgi:hypothetical protein